MRSVRKNRQKKLYVPDHFWIESELNNEGFFCFFVFNFAGSISISKNDIQSAKH